jgi:hypothetical protein
MKIKVDEKGQLESHASNTARLFDYKYGRKIRGDIGGVGKNTNFPIKNSLLSTAVADVGRRIAELL